MNQKYRKMKYATTATTGCWGLENLNFVFRLKRESQIYVVPGDRISDRKVLVRLAPQVFWCNLSHQDKLSTDVCYAIGDQITRLAGELGQVDRSNFIERGAIRIQPSGLVVYHLGDRLLAEGREVDLNENTDRVWLSGPPLDLGSPARSDAAKDIARAVLQLPLGIPRRRAAVPWGGWPPPSLAGRSNGGPTCGSRPRQERARPGCLTTF